MSSSLQIRSICDDCGRDAPLLGRCRCGSTVRRRVDPGDVFRRPATDDAPRWDPLKDWSTKYLQLLWNLEQLHRFDAPGSGADQADVRRTVELTFAASSSLATWLTAGPEPASVTPGDVSRLLAADPLRIAAALTSPTDGERARLVPVGFSRPPRFWVEYQRPPRRPVRYEARDLASRCVVTWQGFLTQRGVRLPTWRS